MEKAEGLTGFCGRKTDFRDRTGELKMKPDTERAREMQEQAERIEGVLRGIKHRIVVFSGKGGVGKTTVAVNLAYALVKRAKKVGLLDADITGPNVPKMTGAVAPYAPGENPHEIHPHVREGLSIISIAPMLPEDSPVIWRGPLRSGAIRQFLADVVWGELDYLLADLPPGTGDEILTTVQEMHPQMAVVVTTPQEVSLVDCRRAVNMAKKMNIPVIGVIENMSGLICPHCGGEIDLFGTGGGKDMARRMGVAFLGRIPLEVKTRISGDQGKPVVLHDPESPVSAAFDSITQNVEALLK
ncbi:Mrp/NBP35 family ATP-binding protein [bacterium]|nr:Mrp/NBP35 family ATP-binding protein [bacterium]